MGQIELKQLSDYIWEIPPRGGMRVPARIFASQSLLQKMQEDDTLKQACHMAYMPGIYKYSITLPDAHQGYGFPVGGVAALDTQHGAISPGGIGYDLNCLTKNALVLHENGYYRSIEAMQADWAYAELRCQDFERLCDSETRAVFYLKQKAKNPVYRMTTTGGDQIEATAEHPFWTPQGMVELKELRTGGRAAVYPFQGVAYAQPSAEIILDRATFIEKAWALGKSSRGNGLEQILKQIDQLGLLPLRHNSPQLPRLLRLLGYVFGDGTISFLKPSQRGAVTFYGKQEDLERIREDVAALGFSLNSIYSRRRQHRIATTYREYEFMYTENSFLVRSGGFAILLAALGAPVGNKAAQDYRLSPWLKTAALWQKRLFLAALFGAELSKPQPYAHRGYNFHMPVLSMNKREGFIQSGRLFLEELSGLLFDFGVVTQKISERPEQINRDGTRSYRLRLWLSSRADSLISLWSKVGFEYHQERRAFANAAVQYLKIKQKHLGTRADTMRRVRELVTAGATREEMHTQLTGNLVNERFIERSMYEERPTGVRVGQEFATFEAYHQWATEGLGQSGMVWDEIASIEPVDYEGYVYDFTVNHPDHNFIANGFVVSNCGVRVCKSNLTVDNLQGKEEQLVNLLFSQIPSGIGKGSIVGKLSKNEIDDVARRGVAWALDRKLAVESDLEHCEDDGVRPGADPSKVSNDAKERAQEQLGSLGSGNHFVEVQRVADIYDETIAQNFGLFKDQIVFTIHCGSRGYGHQICTDYLKYIEREHRDLLNSLPDRQLACAPAGSRLAEDYYGAMNCAINFAWTNRQLIMWRARECFEKVFHKSWPELQMNLLYDVAHNIGKKEVHSIEGKLKEVYVHRKGATRSFPAGRRELPTAFQNIGQPVIIPGSMGTGTYILVGSETAMELTFGSTAHGAGRLMSRSRATREYRADTLVQELKERGIYVRGQSKATIAEEAPGAYKDLDEVVRVSHEVGIGQKVARLTPICNIKG